MHAEPHRDNPGTCNLQSTCGAYVAPCIAPAGVTAYKGSKRLSLYVAHDDVLQARGAVSVVAQD